jgi:hypothetical protein
MLPNIRKIKGRNCSVSGRKKRSSFGGQCRARTCDLLLVRQARLNLKWLRWCRLHPKGHLIPAPELSRSCTENGFDGCLDGSAARQLHQSRDRRLCVCTYFSTPSLDRVRHVQGRGRTLKLYRESRVRCCCSCESSPQTLSFLSALLPTGCRQAFRI